MSKLLVVRDLTKSFPGQVALDNFDIDIDAGRTHALVGQNGSGKSTFIKILAGFHQPDPGSVATLAGRTLHLGDGREAEAAGVRFVHQDLGLVDTLNSIENISMGVGYTTGRFGRIDWKADRRRAAEGLQALGSGDVNIDVPVGMLAPSEKTASGKCSEAIRLISEYTILLKAVRIFSSCMRYGSMSPSLRRSGTV